MSISIEVNAIIAAMKIKPLWFDSELKDFIQGYKDGYVFAIAENIIR